MKFRMSMGPGNNDQCCGKPVGCEATHTGCSFLSHKWKRENVPGLKPERQGAIELSCWHPNAVEVDLRLTGETVAWWCPDCEKRLQPEFLPRPHLAKKKDTNEYCA